MVHHSFHVRISTEDGISDYIVSLEIVSCLKILFFTLIYLELIERVVEKCSNLIEVTNGFAAFIVKKTSL